MTTTERPASGLRVGFIAGSLTQGGAEKQLVYMAEALRDAGVDLRVYSLTKGEFYESALQTRGIEPIWVGAASHPAARLAVLAAAFRTFRPHIIQSTHFFANLYAGILGRLGRGALGVGSIRNDGFFDAQANGRWAPWLLRVPPVLLANSWAARRNVASMGVAEHRVHVLPNVIDLADFDRRSGAAVDRTDGPIAVAVCRLVAMKRLDRFVRALARARRDVPALRGVIVGDGPERGPLEALARATDGLDGQLTFVGRSDDVPALLRRADMLVLSSDHEGFPNVVLEAMSAGLPVVATPAGDVSRVVAESETGYVVAFDDIEGMAAQMVRLSTDRGLRERLGRAGRARVERDYDRRGLGRRMFELYRSMAEARGHAPTLAGLGREPHGCTRG